MGKPAKAANIIQVLFTLLSWPFLAIAIVLTAFFINISKVTGLSRNRKIEDFWGRLWCKSTLWTFFLRTNVKGKENDIPNKPAIVISNHQSFFDIPVVYAALGGSIRMLGKAELFKIPFFGWASKSFGQIPVDRKSAESRRASLKLISERLNDSYQVWLAPEGTRSKDGELQEFKKGAFRMAIQNQVPIIPVVIYNAYLVQPRKSLWVRFGRKIDAEVLPAISTEGLGMKDLPKLLQETHVLMEDKLKSFHTS